MSKVFRSAFLIGFLIVSSWSCQLKQVDKGNTNTTLPLLEAVTPEKSGITHRNMLHEYEGWNYLDYTYFYNGGGVAIGDVNNDGLQDIYLSANQGPGALYLNKGNFEFEDITQKSGINTADGWKTGVAFADLNGDGWLDLYICRAGLPKDGDLRRNLVYINNRDLTYSERSKELGLADTLSSISANFFDYDLDGDLDIFIVNHTTDFHLTSALFYSKDSIMPRYGDNNLYQQQADGTFKEVSDVSGILTTPSFTLSATVLDYNKDGWPDLFVCNDFWGSERLYVNNQDGTFTNLNNQLLAHNSLFSMGSDAADFNNDGWPDLVSVDMMPNDNRRQKSTYNQFTMETFRMLSSVGKHPQFSRNMLFYNDGGKRFAEAAMLSGIEATDWSWAVIGADIDNDGWKDLLVTNGIRREVHDLDYTQKKFGEFDMAGISPYMTHKLGVVEGMPVEWLPNFAFRNNQDLTFENVSGKWGFTQPLCSQAMSMGDLDNDGDLDIVISNTDTIASVYRNRSNEDSKNNFVRLKLEGEGKNAFAIGASATLYAGGKTQYLELQSTRGYQSSSESVLHFGLGAIAAVDSIVVLWPGHKSYSAVKSVKINSTITVSQENSLPYTRPVKKAVDLPFANVSSTFINLSHKENKFTDFDVDRLIPRMYSAEGPALAASDINNDGDDDIFISGSKGNKSALWLSGPNGYVLAKSQPWNNDLSYEVINAVFFDANGDSLLDLYLASGSNEFNANDACQQDRLFVNNGNGGFKYDQDALPQMYTSTKAIAANDIDNDGDMDLFVGGLIVPRSYGISPRSYLLVNEKGRFTDATKALAPDLVNPGLITSAIWADMDGDKVFDLVLGGEYMPISIFTNKRGKLSPIKVADNGLEGENGWWHSLAAHDFDNDGDMDLIAGNHGLNVIFDCSKESPTILYVNDFDKNGSLDPVLTCDINGVRAPFLSRDIFCEQMPEYNNKFLTNTKFANTPFDSMFTADLLADAKKLVLSQLRSGYFENLGAGKFHFKPFENLAQLGPIYGIQLLDANNDGFMDVLVAGNSNTDHYLYGNADASSGLLLLNDGNGNFTYKQHSETGFEVIKKGRSIVRANISDETYYIVPNNNDAAQVFRFEPVLLN
jgi:hypothetical protein